MFACVYFKKDASLTVVNEKEKDLKIYTTFEKGSNVSMQWRAPGKTKETFEGIIIKVGEDKEYLNRFASKAYTAITKWIKPGTTAPSALFSFELKDKIQGGKRERIPAKCLKESRQQDEESTPQKKKKKPVAAKPATVASLFCQFASSLPETTAIQKSEPAVSVSGTQESSNSAGILTGLTDTWEACHGALNVLDSSSAPSAEETPVRLPAVSANVVATLRGLVSPEFTDFIRRLADHMESSTCPHTCLKTNVNPQHAYPECPEMNVTPGGFLSQLEDADSFQPHVSVTDQVHLQTQAMARTFQYLDMDRDIGLVDHGLTPMTLSPGQQPSTVASSPAVSSVRGKDLIETPRRKSPRKQTLSTSISSTPSADLDIDQADTPRHKSPRKQALNTSISSTPSAEDTDQVKLLPSKDLTVNRVALRKACHTALKKKDNAAFQLMYGLLSHVFSLEELASSRGLGLGKPKPGEDVKPVLDGEKIQILKDYVNTWCRKNVGHSFPEKSMNDAVTERSAYARKQLKRQKP